MNINDFKIVVDSSADLLGIDNIPFGLAPLKIITEDKEYIDDYNLDVEQMVKDLDTYTGKITTSCPSIGDWFNAFGDAKYVFCVSITSGLSGSYNTACLAKAEYEEQYPDRKVFIIDSLSAGPELKLIVEKLQEMILANESFDDICIKIKEYQNKTGLMFMLESLKNLKNNGRVSAIVASLVGFLGIRVIGKASDKGQLQTLTKCKGIKRSLSMIVQYLKEFGFKGGKVRISHCCNEKDALSLKDIILNAFKEAKIEIYKTRGLCSFYAEKGGLLIGFEK